MRNWPEKIGLMGEVYEALLDRDVRPKNEDGSMSVEGWESKTALLREHTKFRRMQLGHMS